MERFQHMPLEEQSRIQGHEKFYETLKEKQKGLKDYLFRYSAPNRLVKTSTLGVYAYSVHPGYTVQGFQGRN